MVTQISKRKMEKIKLIAGIVRSSAEELVDDGLFGPVYRTGEMGGMRLGGACGDCSKVIIDMVRRHVSYGLLEWQAGGFDDGDCDYSHNWLKLRDGSILDVTATQFDPSLPGVYIAKEDKRYLSDFDGRMCEPSARRDKSRWRNVLRDMAEKKLKEMS